jgi:hypothetical protein
METESDLDANTTSKDEDRISVAIGSSRSSTIGAFWRKLDEHYTQRSDVGVQVESDPSDEDPDLRSDGSVGSSSDAGDIDGEPGRQADDQSESEPPAESLGTEADEGTPDDPDQVEEPPSGTDVESTSVERDKQESGQRESEYVDSRFYFAPLQHSRGDYFD